MCLTPKLMTANCCGKRKPGLGSTIGPNAINNLDIRWKQLVWKPRSRTLRFLKILFGVYGSSRCRPGFGWAEAEVVGWGIPHIKTSVFGRSYDLTYRHRWRGPIKSVIAPFELRTKSNGRQTINGAVFLDPHSLLLNGLPLPIPIN